MSALSPALSTMQASPFDWIDAECERRQREGLHRELSPRSADSPLLDLAGNDYLGLARHPELAAAASGAAHRWGAGATGSRLVSGSTALHAELEDELASFCGFESALVLSSGYAANLAAVTALATRGTRLASDARNHASLIDGCRLSRADTVVVPHADPESFAAALRGHSGRALAVTDSVFSVDGNAAPLVALAEACRTQRAALLVDDAHGLGVAGPGGRGAVAAAGLAGAPDVVATVTLSKALGSQGGAVLGPARVIDQLVNSARSFIFDTALAPAAAGAALAGLRLLRREPARADQARTVATDLHRRFTSQGLRGVAPDAAVLALRAPSPEAALRWAADCRAGGVSVGCFRPPSVPDGVSRLRLTARADLTEEQLERAVTVIMAAAPAGALAR